MKNKVFRFLYRFQQKYFGGLGLGRLTVIKKIKLWLFPKVYENTAKFDGFEINLDTSYGLAYPEKYKPYIIPFLKENLKKGDIAVDLGANIGLFTLFMSRYVGQNGKILAFEPGHKNLKFLRSNLSKNKCENVEVFELAVGEKNGKVLLQNEGIHNEVGSGDAEVQVVALDDIVGRADLIKMDIIGYKPKALKGMEKLIKNSPNLKISSAFHPYYIRKQGGDPVNFLKELDKLGFSIRIVRMENYDFEVYDLKPDDFEAAVRDYSVKNKKVQTDIFCTLR